MALARVYWEMRFMIRSFLLLLMAEALKVSPLLILSIRDLTTDLPTMHLDGYRLHCFGERVHAVIRTDYREVPVLCHNSPRPPQ